MPEPVIARVPDRGRPRLEYLGTVEPAPAGGGASAAVPSGAVHALLDTLDIIIANGLTRLFAAIKG